MLLALTITDLAASGPETPDGADIACRVYFRNPDFTGIHRVRVAWGDGTTTTRWGYPDLDNDFIGFVSISHPFFDRDPHTLTVTVWNNNNETLTQTVDSTVVLVPPTLDLGAGSARGALGDPFTLNVAVSDPGGNEITEYAVDWGDGGTPQAVTGAPPAALTHTSPPPAATRSRCGPSIPTPPGPPRTSAGSPMTARSAAA